MKAKRSLVFAVGLGTGALVAANWPTILKKSVQASVVGAKKLTVATVRATENISDILYEARVEVLQESRNGSRSALH
jgi:hypothetical protein